MSEDQDEDKRPRQSGQEAKHEQIVMALMNFLHLHQVPFYRTASLGVRGGHHTPIERLGMVTSMIVRERGELTEAMERVRRLREERDAAHGHLVALHERLKAMVEETFQSRLGHKVPEILTDLEALLIDMGLVKKPKPPEATDGQA